MSRVRALTHRPGRQALLAALAGLAALLLSLATATTATAHANLIDTDPADGAVIPEPPAEVILTFDEPVEVRDDFVRLFDWTGAEHEVTARTSDVQVVVEVPVGLVDGSYVLTWRVISADTHPIAGGLTFAVGAPSESVAEVDDRLVDPAVWTVSAVVRAVGYLGLLAAAGIVIFRMALLPPAQRTPTWTGRLDRSAGVAGVAALGALLLQVPLTSAQQSGRGLGTLIEPQAWADQMVSEPGLTFVVTGAGLMTAVIAARRSRGRPFVAAAAFGGAAVAIGALALVGHTRTFGPPWLVLSSQLLHVGAAAVWFGGLIALGVTLFRATAEDPRAGGEVVARFSAVAAFLVLVLAIAGLLLGWRIVGSWAALFGTTYGLLLLGKVGAALVVVAIAAVNRYRLLPALRRDPRSAVLRRAVGAEVGVLVAVLGLTGFLVGHNPREGVMLAAEEGEPAVAPTVEREFSGGRLSLQVQPGSLGTNALEFELTDPSGAPLEPLDEPRIRLSLAEAGLGPIERPVTGVGPGAYQATADFPLEGKWTIEISVRLSEFDEPVMRVPLEVR